MLANVGFILIRNLGDWLCVFVNEASIISQGGRICTIAVAQNPAKFAP